MNPIPLRAHHILCLLHYSGKGYSVSFTRRMDALNVLLRENPAAMLQLRNSPDILCEACPNLDSQCGEEQTARAYDDQMLSLCGWRVGKVFSWAQLRRTAVARVIRPGRRAEVCGGCEWQELCCRVKW